MIFFRLSKFYLVLLFIFFSQITHCQNFAGALSTTDGQVISYKLVINELKNGSFKGYSITNFESKDYTKSTIEGELDLKNKIFSFRELANTETKSKADASTFCYVSVSNLPISVINKKNVVKGKFKGTFANKKVCATGNLVLVSNDLSSDTTSKTREIKPTEVGVKDSSKTISAHQDSTITDSIFTSNEELLIKDWNKDLCLEIWDGNILDYDEVSVFVNDKLLMDRLVLKREKTIINLPANEVNFSIKIVALNEGRSWKNTLNFRLKNAENQKEYISVLNKGESFSIRFARQ